VATLLGSPINCTRDSIRGHRIKNGNDLTRNLWKRKFGASTSREALITRNSLAQLRQGTLKREQIQDTCLSAMAFFASIEEGA
jgi:hypothetical protein